VLKLPFIPTEKQTGVRAGEAWALKWIDIDPEKSTANILPEKGSNARQLRITGRLMAQLNALPRKSQFIFHLDDADPITSLDHFRRMFDRQRKKVAERLENPRIMQIHWHTLRHFKATMEYHRTKDILHVMQLLGHKNIRNTLIYTHLMDFPNDDYVCKVAQTVKEAQELVEAGFDFVCDVEGYKVFRKRK
jgi:integrase